jgi:hypothetical protein
VDRIHQAQGTDRLWTLAKTNQSLASRKAGNFSTTITTISFSKRTLLHGVVEYTYFYGRRRWEGNIKMGLK